MEASERDNTHDWLLPREAGPPLLDELELRIDEALATARASEQAVTLVGEAAIDAAKQARRAAESAERASASALEASQAAAATATAAEASRAAQASRPGQATQAPGPAAGGMPSPAGAVGDASLRNFSARADRVVARLRALERRPQQVRAPSAVAGRRRPGG
jgi:hypothetical protein